MKSKRDRGERYTEEQLVFVSKNKALPRSALTDAFNKRFGANKSINKLSQLCKRKGWLTGRSGRYKKGHKPWNTGTKGICRATSGCFRKGNKPHNHRPVGSERISEKDGYILVKVAEPKVYRHKHRVLREAAYGGIPEGMKLRFIDGNRLNCSLDNLVLVNKRVHLQLNRNGYSDLPAEFRPAMLAVSELECKVFAMGKN